MFEIGMKVVCVNPAGFHVFPPNEIFTVHEVLCCKKCGEKHITISERPASYNPFGCEICDTKICNNTHRGGSTKNFRPVQDQYTSEEIEAVNIDELKEVLNEPEVVEN